LPQDRIVVPKISGVTFISSLLLLLHHSQRARCKLNASKQCPYEATTSTRLNSHVVRSEPRRTQ
jgi:hypothetical protein